MSLYYTNARVDARVDTRVDNLFDFNPATTPTASTADTYLRLGTTYQVRSTFAVSTLSDRPAASGATVGHIYHIFSRTTPPTSAPTTSTLPVLQRETSRLSPHAATFTLSPTCLPAAPSTTPPLGDFYFHNGGSVVHGGYEFYEVEDAWCSQGTHERPSRRRAGCFKKQQLVERGVARG